MNVMNFNYIHYIPSLRWKQGEYQAVLRLPDTTKKMFTPLIEIPEIGWDFEKAENVKTIDKHLATFAKRVCDKWGESPCFVDMKLIAPSERMKEGTHPVTFIFDKLREMKCSAIPVTGFNRDKIYQQEIKTVLTKDKLGACLRITIEQAAKNSLKSNLDSLLLGLKSKRSDCNFVLDLGAPNFVPLDGFVKVIQGIISDLPYLNEWKTFAILGTSFPETMGGIKKGIKILPRYEWQLYKKLITNLINAKLRLPTFGDCAIAHPNILQLDMRIIKPSATIRYTIDDNWCIVKANNVRDYGLKQYHELSKKLVTSQHYYGETLSYGDGYIQKCADKKIGYGSLSTWRQVGTNHHIEKVTRDIANFYASLKIL